mgnify:CR=1 FL=1
MNRFPRTDILSGGGYSPAPCVVTQESYICLKKQSSTRISRAPRQNSTAFPKRIFLSADKITADTVRYGNTYLYVDYAMYLFLGFIFVVRNCVQGIGRSRFVLGAGAAELVARIAVCLTLPAAVAGGVVSAQANPLAFYALCAADPMAWIAADTVLAIPFFRNILRRDYRYMNI